VFQVRERGRDVHQLLDIDAARLALMLITYIPAINLFL
jgi:hypothetical protein